MLDKPFELKMDKTPTLVYVQEKNIGIGKLYLNGIRIEGLQAISIEANTRTLSQSPCPILKIQVVPEVLAKLINDGER